MKFNLTKMALVSLLSTILFSSTIFAKTQIEDFLTDIDLQYFDSGINQVDCVYVINLEHRPQKWADTRAIFHSHGINPNRVNAINGWMLSEQDK